MIDRYKRLAMPARCCMIRNIERHNTTGERTMTRAELIEELSKVQNQANNQDRDIMTIAAMMDNEQLAAHIERNR